MHIPLYEEWKFNMAEINSARLNNYVSQQAAQQSQSQSQISIGDDTQKKRDAAVADKISRGVIVQISREARELIKASLEDTDLEFTLSQRDSQNNLQSAIVNAKFRQKEDQEKINQKSTELANKLNEASFEKNVLAA